MLFSKPIRFGVTNSKFISHYYIAYANLSKVNINNKLSVSSSIAIDEKKSMAMIKCYNEYLERLRMAIPLLKKQKMQIINIINYSSKINDISDFGYGYSKKFGYNDTTGTASGRKSERIVKKALYELLEKNEMLSFWYSDIGKIITPNPRIEEKIKNLQFFSDKIHLFYSCELSTLHTCFVILFKNGKFNGSGVACSEKYINAVDLALEEARIFEWQNYDNPSSYICKLTKKQNCEIIEHINYKIQTYPCIEYNLENTIEIKFVDWIKDINICMLNNNSSNKTIKCCSNQLISCLPSKDNIKKSDYKKIIDIYYDENVIDCVLS